MCIFKKNRVESEKEPEKREEEQSILLSRLPTEDKQIVASYSLNYLKYIRIVNQNIENKYSRLLTTSLTFTGLLITALGVIFSFKSFNHLSSLIIWLLIIYGVILSILFCILISMFSLKLFSKTGEIGSLTEYISEINESKYDAFDSTLTEIDNICDVEFNHNKKIKKNKKITIVIYISYLCLSVIFFLVVSLLSE